MTCAEMVREFHASNGAVIDGWDNGPEVAALRIGLIVEEFSETITAMRNNDVIEAADGMADLLYVIAGTAVSYGTMSACDKLPPRSSIPLVKSFAPNDVYNFIHTTLPLIDRLANVLMTSDSRTIIYAINGLWMNVSWTAVWIWGLPINELFNEVHRSNMTKTFAPDTNHSGGKYGAVNPKGPGYSPPDIHGVLDRAEKALAPCITAPQSHP
jgi:predicted HAD superfamily Cof-like phosphohydrolase